MKHKIIAGVVLINLMVVAAIAQQWKSSDINGDGQVNLLDLAILGNHYLEPNRVWLLSRVAELEEQVELYKKRFEIQVEKIKSFDWFLFVGKQQWGIDPNEIRMLYDSKSYRPVEINWFSPDRLEVVINRGDITVGVFFDPNGMK